MMSTARSRGVLWVRRGLVLVLLLATSGLLGVSPPAWASPDAQHPGHDQPGGMTPQGVAPLLGNLGDLQHTVTIASPLAQKYFDEGLILTFGFNHAEAIRSYRDAIKLDPACAMCYWGIAFALGPNINAAMEDAAVPDAFMALQKAVELAAGASAVEQAYIKALTARYVAEPPSDRSSLDLAYANAMRDLAKAYPDDLDAASLFAEALMDLTPWKFWTRDGQHTQYTAEIVSTLEAVLARAPNHPAANHYYIHAVEASQTPERAVPSAERLATLVPGAGHLVHMPAHVYWRVGRYHDAAVANEHAIHTDEAYIPDRGAQGSYPLGYYPHNIHFLFAAVQMEGRSELAIATARKLVEALPENAFESIPSLEDFRPMPTFALVRFGRWDEVLREPAPPPVLQYSTAIWHWSLGVAHARQGQLDMADSEMRQLEDITKSDAVKAQGLASFAQATTILDIASNILAAEIAGARGQAEAQVQRLREAVTIQDALDYTEPPPWAYPIRQSLGAALLKAGRAGEAEAVYREDLRQYRDNGWSLFGLSQALRAQGKNTEADDAQRLFDEAWRFADVKLTASSF